MLARMRWLPLPAVLAAALAPAPEARAEDAPPVPRVITLECTVPPSMPRPPAPGAMRLTCRLKDDPSVPGVALALIDPFTTPSWETLDPFAPGDRITVVQPLTDRHPPLVDPFAPAGPLPDPFDGDVSDEP
jgi:hypothetical protein